METSNDTSRKRRASRELVSNDDHRLHYNGNTAHEQAHMHNGNIYHTILMADPQQFAFAKEVVDKEFHAQKELSLALLRMDERMRHMEKFRAEMEKTWRYLERDRDRTALPGRSMEIARQSPPRDSILGPDDPDSPGSIVTFVTAQQYLESEARAPCIEELPRSTEEAECENGVDHARTQSLPPGASTVPQAEQPIASEMQPAEKMLVTSQEATWGSQSLTSGSEAQALRSHPNKTAPSARQFHKGLITSPRNVSCMDKPAAPESPYAQRFQPIEMDDTLSSHSSHDPSGSFIRSSTSLTWNAEHPFSNIPAQGERFLSEDWEASSSSSDDSCARQGLLLKAPYEKAQSDLVEVLRSWMADQLHANDLDLSSKS